MPDSKETKAKMEEAREEEEEKNEEWGRRGRRGGRGRKRGKWRRMGRKKSRGGAAGGRTDLYCGKAQELQAWLDLGAQLPSGLSSLSCPFAGMSVSGHRVQSLQAS